MRLPSGPSASWFTSPSSRSSPASFDRVRSSCCCRCFCGRSAPSRRSLVADGEEEERLSHSAARPVPSHRLATGHLVPDTSSMPIARLGFSRNGVWVLDEPSSRRRSSDLRLASPEVVQRPFTVREFAIFQAHNGLAPCRPKERGERQHQLTTMCAALALPPHCEALLAAGCVHPFSLVSWASARSPDNIGALGAAHSALFAPTTTTILPSALLNLNSTSTRCS